MSEAYAIVYECAACGMRGDGHRRYSYYGGLAPCPPEGWAEIRIRVVDIKQGQDPSYDCPETFCVCDACLGKLNEGGWLRCAR